MLGRSRSRCVVMKLLSSHTLPSTMRVLALTRGGVELVERPVPTPPAGKVLVQMRAAPINPTLGTIAGFEGSGTVIASGGGSIGPNQSRLT